MKKVIRSIVATLVLAFCFQPTQAQSPETKQLTYSAYLGQGLSKWEEALKEVESQYTASDQPSDLINIVHVKYGLLNATMAEQDEDSFDKYLEGAKEDLDFILELDPKHADAHTVKAAVLSLQIAYSPLKGMFLGPKSDTHIEKALKYEPESAFAWKMFASSKLFTPAMFGGDIEEAVKSYEKAINLFEKNDSDIAINWLYLDALAWLGQAYMRNERHDEAVSTFEKALEIEPNFGWVKFALLPAAKEKASN